METGLVVLLFAAVLRMLSVTGHVLPSAAVFAGGHLLIRAAWSGGYGVVGELLYSVVELGYCWIWFALLSRFDGTFAWGVTLILGLVLPVVALFVTSG